MTDRSIRRAAERKALKATRKADRQAGIQNPVSEAQLAANRANAQLAQGAVTPEGKAISSRNHTTHGLTAIPAPNFKVLPDEDQSVYNASLAGYQAEWKPITATEHDLVNGLATHAWLRDRAIRFQNNILLEVGEITAVEDRKEFALFMRYYSSHARAYVKAFSEIMRLRNFQMRQRKDEAIIERRAIETKIRFESQKQNSEIQAAKLETIRLKQEAIKQRNQKTQPPALLLTRAAGSPAFCGPALS